MPPRLLFLLLIATAAGDLAAAPAAITPDAADFFEKRIRPVLVESCYECHSATAKKVKGELRVDSRDLLIKGGESGTALVLGDPASSRLIEAITYRNADLQMPPKKKLSDAAIADLTQWVKMGAPWPAEASPTIPTTDAKPAIDFEARKREHWAWQPVKKQEPPKVKNEAWVRTEIDRFILATLEAKNLKPTRQADPRTLIRRVYFDLIGLPPSPEEVEAFVKECENEGSEFRVPSSELESNAKAEQSPAPATRNSERGTRNSAAFSRLVDRLLASPAYGERWARHWLDVVRYADSKDSRGQGGEVDIPFAYRYRDWVVDAFNRDLPYDRFIIDQIAGDLDPSRGERTAGIIATTMLAIGNWETGCSDKRKMMTDIVDDQVDVISRGFLGMTVACARCHDHKFDPISTRDYYALAGFFFSSHIIPAPGDPTAGTPMLRVPLMVPEEVAAIHAAAVKVEEIKKQINAEIDARRKEVVARELSRISNYLAAAAEYYRRDPANDTITLSAVAAKHSIHAELLKHFMRYAGLQEGSGLVPGLFTTKLSEVLKNPRVNGWGSPDTPMALAHTGTEAAKLLTFTLPPRSLALHPAPTKQVALGWRSPISGTVKIAGKAADADPNGGNGVRWSIAHRHGSATTKLASGHVASGAAVIFQEADRAGSLEALTVESGDLISLSIDPADGNHICDTTTIELTITALDGRKQSWDATKDLVDSIHAGNPHADSHGNRGVWLLYAIDLIGGSDPGGVPAGSVLAHWLAIVADRKVDLNSTDVLRRLTQAAIAVESLATGDGKNRSVPDAALFADLTNAANSPLWTAVDLVAYSEDTARLTELNAQMVAQNRIAAKRIDFAQGIAEGGVPGSEHAGVRAAKVHIRGRYDRLGDVVPRGFPALISAKPQAMTGSGSGSGRGELARWIASKENPMTARVMVNRLWQHHFGRGLVATPDNFGHLGDRPSHPELLDYLADRFVANDWSIKAIHKMIVTSAVYMQESKAGNQESGVRNNAAGEPRFSGSPASIDADNRLLWRQNRRRLDAEQMRDAMLVAAGRYDRAQGPTPGPATADLSAARRTLYVMAVRSDTSNFRTLFDAADPTSSIHARSESTVAPQALFMLNHPFAQEMASALAARVLRDGGANDDTKITWLYGRLFSRPAAPREVDIATRVLSNARSGASDNDRTAWQQYVQVLLCSNEFMYVD